MTRKLFCYLMSILLIFCAMYPGMVGAITTEELTNRCQSAENAIRDISFEYEWYVTPTPTFEDVEEPLKSIGVLITKDGVSKHKLSAARFIDPNGRHRWRYVFEESATLIAKDGQTWDIFVKYSYDGRVYKKFSIDGPTDKRPTDVTSGLITSNNPYTGIPLLTPIGFSIFRFENGLEDNSLSTILQQRKDEDIIRVIDAVKKVNDFNTICVDLLQRQIKLPYTHVYLSVDHNYTPVKHEHLKNLKTGEIALTVEVHSLERIGDGLWFPTSGLMHSPNGKQANAFQVTGKILVIQGLKEKDFDVEFPVGTKVTDRVRNIEYVVKAPGN